MLQLMVSSIYHHKPMSSFYRIVSIKAGFAKLKDMYIAAAAAAAKSLHLCLTLCDPIDGSPPGFPIPPGKNTGVGCHFLLQCIIVF